MGFEDGNVVAAEAVEFDVLGRDGDDDAVEDDDDIACGNQSFCQLLLSNDGEVELEHSFRFSPPPLFHNILPASSSSSSSCCSTSSPSSGLLCFGSTVEGDEPIPVRERTPSKRKRNDGHQVRKKPNSSNKGKKEKLGERVAALQQLVSPFGKTDTASVLHEAMGYIKFLQEQVQVLCTPYLQQQQPPPPPSPDDNRVEGGGGGGGGDLRSRGLCLAPVAYCVHMQGSGIIGADFWSPSTRR